MAAPQPTRRVENERLRRLRNAKQAAERDIGAIPPPEDAARRARLEADPPAWLRWYLPDWFSDPFADYHLELIDITLDTMQRKVKQAVAAPRGGGKTTIVRGLCVFAICTGQLSFLTIIGKSLGVAVEQHLETIKAAFAETARLIDDYPEICLPIVPVHRSPRLAAQQTYTDASGEPRFTAFSWSGDGVTFPVVEGSPAAGVIIKIRGADSAIRGLNVQARRPDWVLIDDPDDDESARSELQADKRLKNIRQGVLGLGTMRNPIGAMVLTTIPAAGSVSDVLTDPEQDAAWRGKRIPFLRTWPRRADLWDEYVGLWQSGKNPLSDVAENAAELFYRKHRGEMDDGADVIDEAAHEATQLSAIQAAYDIIAERGMEAFLCEYQQDPPRPETTDEERLDSYTVARALSGRDEWVVPDETTCTTLFIDLGKYQLHWSVLASMADASADVVAYGVHQVSGASAIGTEEAILRALIELWDGEDGLANQPLRTDNGETMTIALGGVDAGNWNSVAYAFCRKFPLFVPCMGLASYTARRNTTPTERPGFHLWESRQIQERVWVVNHDTDYFRRRVHDGFAAASGAKAEVAIPGGLRIFGEDPNVHRQSETDRYADQIVAEWRVEGELTAQGRPKPPYWKRRGKNHYLDCTSGCLVLAAKCGVRPVGEVKTGTRRIKLSELQAHKRRAG